MQEFEASYRSAVNRHGYAFQHSLIRFIENLGADADTWWREPVPEFPVSVGGRNTRIDLVLSFRRSGLYLVGECKRVNPALGRWCFISRKIKGRLSTKDQGFFVQVVEGPADEPTALLREVTPTDVYHVGLEVKTRDKGDGSKSGRGAIEDAATQVLLGTNGLIELFTERPELWDGVDRLGFVPVVFTTAELFVADEDIGEADLATGNVAHDAAQLRPVPWLVYHYPLSRGLQHSIDVLAENDWDKGELAGVLYQEFVRSIAVVSTRGIKDFLSWDQWEIFTRIRDFRR